ncbi:MAG: type II and III secretion system protein, partial [Candidatus Omnitrophica bacterium]|nr:type II and III secretion system protein [Candidatus Omnitrophota bacterium]
KITVLDNETATIKVKTEDPVPNYTYNKDTGSWEISGFEKYEYGVSLEVTPQINQEGYITLDVKPEVNEKLSDKTFTSGSGLETTVPVLTTQKTQTKVMIKDGETLIIAGLIRDKTTDVVKKVPLLGDIPYLGYFFKHKSTTKVKKNLLVFITPTIVTPTR